jgi:hypothetical protein
MSHRVEVVRSEGDLRREVWEFACFEFPKVVLDVYRDEDRSSRRHRKWRTLRRYQRLKYGNFYGERIAEEPTIPNDVVEEAVDAFRAMVKFHVWRRR